MQAQLLEAVVAASLDAIVCADEEGNTILWNKAAEAMFGWTEAEALGRPLIMLLRKQDRAAHLEGIRRFLESGEGPLIGKVTETMGLRKDGSTFPKEMSLAAEKVDGRWVFIAILRDISESKKREHLLQHILSATPAVHYACRREGERWPPTFASPNLKELFGYAPDTVLGDDEWWWTHLHPEDRERVLHEFRSALDEGNTRYAHEYRFQSADGGYRWILDELSILRDAAGRPLEIVGSWLGITERKQLEETLKQRVDDAEKSRQAMLFMLEDLNASKEQIERAKKDWEATFDAVTDPIFLHDGNFHILRANRAYARYAGLPVEQVIGKPYWQVFPRMDGPLHCCAKMLEAEEEEEEEVNGWPHLPLAQLCRARERRRHPGRALPARYHRAQAG